ncbi:diguanylate cyclase (GGDEF)-like protein/PAS domain S-box-containing protein [Granulicella aggregans]|uniref:diguanylate cyclase n=1 Tax=Granulicella aggregans TaxID=474949 RepID=A0A7W8E365_9BACT|nr:diguanylate cyclase (GGDEF)-like protein/PAS domain S-box-containing protein [Granulicella aggregans]
MIANSDGLKSNASDTPTLLRLLKVGFALLLLSTFASVVNERSRIMGGVSIIWLSNGLLIGVLLCAPRKHWASYLALGYLVDFGVNVGLGNPAGISGYLSLCNMVEVAVAAHLTCDAISEHPDLTELRQLRSFLLYAVLFSPLLASAMAILGWGAMRRGVFFHSLLIWFAADVLGVATVTPLYISFHHRRRFSNLPMLETVGLFLGLIAVSIFVFDFAKVPLVWLVLLMLILIGSRVGFTGSALGLLLVLFIGGLSVLFGRGPLNFALNGSLSSKIFMFQVFIFVSMLALYLTEVAMARSARTRLRLEASETRFRLLAEASRDMIVLAGLDGERKYVSPAATELLGWSQEELLRGSYLDIVHPEDIAKFVAMLGDCREGKETGSLSYRCRKQDSTYLWLEANVRLFRDTSTNEPAGFVYVKRDISERKVAESKLQDAFNTVEQLALVDGLTGVANRRLLDETLGREWARAIRDGTLLSVLLIDVDYFKPYNDLYGHLAGDTCLRALANAIQVILRRPPDLLARYGGEEFVVVLPNTPHAGAEAMSERILQAVEQCCIKHAGSPYGNVSVSVGCATGFASLESDPNELLKAADLALYRAKAAGRNRAEVATTELLVN